MNERGSRKIPVTERQFLWVQDDDKGEVTLHVGPTMVSPTAADRIVIDDGVGGFCEDLSGRPQMMIEVGDHQYAVLFNPLLESDGGPNGRFRTGRNEAKGLKNGTRSMIPGPCSFYLRPGQRCEVRDAHELSSNQYIVVKVYGPDLEILQDKADQIVNVLNSIRGATDVASIKIGGQTELSIRLDRQKTARLGISIADAGNVIQTALAGNGVSTFFEGDRRFDVTLRLALPFRDAVDDIGALQVPLPGNAGTVALSELATIEIKQGASRIGRENGGRLIPVKVNLYKRDQGSFVAEAQARVAKEVGLPPGYYLTWGGQFENQQRALKRLQVIVPISLFSMFALLFWAFKSIKRAVLVLLMIPFTAIGGFAGLALAGLHVSISAAVGFIAVAGISVQNGVIMVEHIVELYRNGYDLARAIVEGAVTRMRPILMTALMAGLGLLPAALSSGIGSETQRPFAVVIVGGIVSATVFTLLLLPVLYALMIKEGES